MADVTGRVPSTEHGSVTFQLVEHALTVWAGLTRAQRHTLRDPATATGVPARSLRLQGLINTDGLTEWGRLVLKVGDR